MAMHRYNPYHGRSHLLPISMRSMAHDFDDLFDSFIDNSSALRIRENAGQLKIADNGDSFEYIIHVGGYRPEDLKVDVEDGFILIQGDHKEERVGESVHRSFKRRFRIPDGIDHHTIKCEIDNVGVLYVQGSKQAIDASKKRTIPIGQKTIEQPTDAKTSKP